MKAASWRLFYLAAGLVLRAGLLSWGEYQDRTQAVPYTDIDYLVFTDAAKLVVDGCPLSKTVESPDYESDADLLERTDVQCARGMLPAAARFLLLNDPINHTDKDDSPFRSNSVLFRSANRCYSVARPVFRALATVGDPYARPTYRYTPWLATILAPIHLLGWAHFGKYLFAASDLACAVLMWLLLDGRRPQGSAAGIYVHLPGLMWILNPIPAQISTRGSSESLVGLSVLLFVYYFLKTNPEAPLGLRPVHENGAGAPHDNKRTSVADPQISSPIYRPMVPENALPIANWSIEAFLAPIMHGAATHFKLFPVIYSVPVLSHLYSSTMWAHEPSARSQLRFWTRHAAGLQFGLVSFASFMVMNVFSWAIWGSPFIEHTFTYHLKRVDHRHNFSPYFLGTHLSSYATHLTNQTELSLATKFLSSSLLSFGPQLLIVVLLGYQLGKRDVVAAMTAQTVAFVAFNKVCTSQYFVWFLWLLPLVWPSLKTSRAETFIALTAWIGAQGVWLSQAYQLEFTAQPAFARIWASSVLLLAVHTALLAWFLSAWTRNRVKVSKFGLSSSNRDHVKHLKSQ